MKTRISRRKFLQISGLAAGATILPLPMKWLGARDAYAFYQSSKIPLFSTTLRGVGPGQIPVAAPDLTPAPVTGVTHYTINIQKFKDSGVCPALGTTTLWGYNPARPLGGGSQPAKHLGGILVGKRGQPIQVTFRNNLPQIGPGFTNKHIIPVDTSSFFPEASHADRMAVHLHGGLVPWISDGGPYDWFEPNGTHGPSFVNNAVLNPAAALNEAEYFYPTDQSARFVWYHDHAHDTTRLNAYAGVASAYLIRDDFEAYLKKLGLPEFIENSVLGGKPVRELPLVFQDKIFVGSNINIVDPTWKTLVDPDATKPGSLWYPHVYERARWRRAYSALPLPDPSCIAEMFGDTMLVNGTVFPHSAVKPRRYRLRLLNACNARWLNLQWYIADNSPEGITLDPNTGNPTNAKFLSYVDPQTGSPTPFIMQIGTEGGFLANPALIPTDQPFNPVTMEGSLIVGSAERPDLIVDFSSHAGTNVILYNDAPAPFPGGDPRNDYFPGLNNGNPINATTPPGFGPNSRIVMRFEVAAQTTEPADLPLLIGPNTDLTPGLDPFIISPASIKTGSWVSAAAIRSLTLNENFDNWGRLIQKLGTDNDAGVGRFYTDSPTEIMANGATEIWEIFNTTADCHPMHFHLVNVQVLERQNFDVNALINAKTKTYLGPTTPPFANEIGWKETIQMRPGTVTRFITKFDLPPMPVFVPPSPRMASVANIADGNEYVWHCHILEHEEHDMMRPLVVTGNSPTFGFLSTLQVVEGAVGGIVPFKFFGGTGPYAIATDKVSYPPSTTLLAVAGSFTVPVPAGSTPVTVKVTVTDGNSQSITATLNIL